MNRLSILFLVPNLDHRSLLNSLIDELSAQGVAVMIESYLPTSKMFLGNPEINFDRIGNFAFDSVVVLDLGFLNGKKVKRKFPDKKLILFGGDTPQSLPSHSLFLFIANVISKIFLRSDSPYIRRFGLLKSARFYDVVLASDPAAVSKFKEKGSIAIWFPYWAENISKNIAQPGAGEYTFDLVTVMTPRPERRELLNFLSESKSITFCNIYGLQQSQIQNLYVSGLAVLNSSSFGEVTIRFFEAFAAGKVVVTDELNSDSGLRELFVEGQHYFTYRDKEDLLKVVVFLRENEMQIQNFGKSAHQLVLEKHRPIHRALKLVNIIEGL